MVAIDLITEHIRIKLQQPDLRRIYPNLELVPSNFQIRGMHTLIRDATTPTPDFVFYADRLLRLVRAPSSAQCCFQKYNLLLSIFARDWLAKGLVMGCVLQQSMSTLCLQVRTPSTDAK